jgi:hypothetical protein
MITSISVVGSFEYFGITGTFLLQPKINNSKASTVFGFSAQVQVVVQVQAW